MKTGTRRHAHLWGIAAEYMCMALLLCKGYTILERRHRNRGGEIDLIVARGGFVIFIEVKARASEAEALESITADKRRRLARAAGGFIARHARYAQHGLRFDVMVVTSPWKIAHHPNAWSL